MKRNKIAIGILLLVLAVATPALAASWDFASLRRAADGFAEKSQPGSKIWRIDVTASYESGALEIHEEVFYYFYEQPQGLNVMKVHVLPQEATDLPKVERRNWAGLLSVEQWLMTPMPENVLPPEEALRRLKRSLPGDPHRSQTGLLQARDYRGLFDLKLVHAGAALADSSRNQFQWNTLATSLGMKSGLMAQFFARTAPHGKWVWWTVVEQDRPYPGSDPKRAGTARRMLEYIYIDAITGKATSHCTGPSGPVPCEADSQAPPARSERSGAPRKGHMQ
jgi:hypothetical protein